jgi:cytosine/adenosine deaminase-related metal-dependent hydrolase
MRFITADYIFPVSSAPVRNGVIAVDEDGTIMEILSTVDSRQSTGNKMETFRGIICPGFVNSHCHLELSHLKNKLTEGKGLPQFIREVLSLRNASADIIEQAIVEADDEMFRNGIVAVGDISNTNHSFALKQKSKIKYHTFIELFDLNPDRTEEQFQQGLDLLKESEGVEKIGNRKSEIRSSLTPHAPYSATQKLLKKIHDHAYACNGIISIHNQETLGENDMFLQGKGILLDTFKDLGVDLEWFKPTGFNSLPSTLVHLPKCNRLQLVHNTYTTAEDITWAHLYSMMTWWCTCANANLFIENKIPDYKIFLDAGCRMTVGTDSYASNWSLSILDELKTISQHAPFISLETLLRWATLNGADFLGFNKEIGSIEKGKKPGLNLVKNVDLEKLRLTEDSEVEKIL